MKKRWISWLLAFALIFSSVGVQAMDGKISDLNLVSKIQESVKTLVSADSAAEQPAETPAVSASVPAAASVRSTESLATVTGQGTYTDTTALSTETYEYEIVGDDGSVATVEVPAVLSKVYTRYAPNFGAKQSVANGTYIIMGGRTESPINTTCVVTRTENVAFTDYTDLIYTTDVSITDDVISQEYADSEWEVTYDETSETYTFKAPNADKYLAIYSPADVQGAVSATTSYAIIVEENETATVNDDVLIGGASINGGTRGYLNHGDDNPGTGTGTGVGSAWHLYALNYEILDAAITEATANVTAEADYTPETWAKYETALDATEGIFADADAAMAKYNALVAAVDALEKATETEEVELEIVYKRITSADNIENGNYVISGAHNDTNNTKIVKSDEILRYASGYVDGTIVEFSSKEEALSYVWYISGTSDQYTIRALDDGKYLAMTGSGTNGQDSQATGTSETAQTLVIENHNNVGNAVVIGTADAFSDGTKGYLNNRRTSGDNAGLGTWTTGASDNGSALYLYKEAYRFSAETLDNAVLEANGGEALGDETAYTSDTWSAYQNALDKAREVFDTEEAAVEAYNNLVDAVKKLEENQLPGDISGMVETGYIRVTDLDEITDGNYVIAGVNTGNYDKAIKADMGYTEVVFEGKFVSPKDESNPMEIWNITNSTDGYTIEALDESASPMQGIVIESSNAKEGAFSIYNGSEYWTHITNGNDAGVGGSNDNTNINSAWNLYKETYRVSMENLYKVVCEANGGDFLFSEEVYTSESGMAYRDALKAAREGFDTVDAAVEAVEALKEAVKELQKKELVEAYFPEMKWNITRDITDVTLEDGTTGPNYVSSMPYVDIAEEGYTPEEGETYVFPQYSAMPWSWNTLKRLVENKDVREELQWSASAKDGMSSVEFSANADAESAGESNSWASADVYKIAGEFTWPEDYDLHKTTVVLDSKNDFFYRDIYENLTDQKITDYFPMGQVFPINDDVYVVLWAEVDGETAPQLPVAATETVEGDDGINEHLAFWAGTSGKGVWTHEGMLNADWRRRETATFLAWDLQGERTFWNAWPNIIGSQAIAEDAIATENAKVENWKAKYLQHTDGWYTITDTSSINSVLRENYREGIPAGTTVHIDLYVMNNSTEGVIDELEIELFTETDPSVTVNYYLNSVTEANLLGKEHMLNVPVGTALEILPGVQAGQLNSYKAQAIHDSGYQSVTDGVQLGEVPFIVTADSESNVINVLYRVEDQQVVNLYAGSSLDNKYNGNAYKVENVRITEEGQQNEVNAYEEDGIYQLPSSTDNEERVVCGVYAKVEETLPGIYQNVFKDANGNVIATDANGAVIDDSIVVKARTETVDGIDEEVLTNYTVYLHPGELQITYEPEAVTKTYDFGVKNNYDVLNDVEKTATVTLAENQPATLENNVLSYQPTTVNTGETVDLTLTFAGDYRVTKTVNFVPASNVLYGDHFFAKADTSVWTSEGTAANYVVDDNDGTVYGYTEDIKEDAHSDNSVLKATLDVNGNSGVQGITAKTDALTFTFTGTGFDLLSACGPDTGMIVAKVTDAGGDVVKSYLVDTYFTGDFGSTPIIGAANAETHQVPVVRNMELTPGTYTVTVYGYLLNTSGALRTFAMDDAAIPTEDLVMTALDDLGLYDIEVDDVEVSFMDEDSVLNGGSGNLYAESAFGGFALTREADEAEPTASAGKDSVATVYVDGFRVYQPLNDDSVYVANEQRTTYHSVYDFIKTSVNDLTGVVDNAMLYIEYDGNTGVSSIVDYKIQGPQNEVYLTGGNAVAFALNGYNVGNVVQVGAKLVTPGAALSSDNGTNSKELYATEMYYDVTVQSTESGMKYVAIKNTGAAGTVLALSGLKVSSNVGIYASAEVGEQIIEVPSQEGGDAVAEVKITTAEEVVADRYFTVRIETSTDIDGVNLIVPGNGSGNVTVALTAENAQAVEQGVADVYRYSKALAAKLESIVNDTYTFIVEAYTSDGTTETIVATKTVVVDIQSQATTQ